MTAIVLGWFATQAAVLLFAPGYLELPPMTARPHSPRVQRGPTIGCHYERGDEHLAAYEPGATHLHNDRCVFEPPEER